ncbi:MAG: ParA family protein [Pseudomonadota bacterium]
MPVIAVINPKGGVGKTTITLNLGLFLSSQSKNIIFVDLDPQHSLTDWLKRRPKALSQFTCIKNNSDKLCKEDLLPMDKDTYYLLDCPAGMNKKQISNLLGLSDILLIPVTPSPVDLSALTHFFFQLAANEEHPIENIPMALIANRAKVYTRAHTETLLKIKKFNIPLLATFRDTQNYTLPAGRGMGLIDLPDYHVKVDIDSWHSVLAWLKLKHPDL